MILKVIYFIQSIGLCTAMSMSMSMSMSAPKTTMRSLHNQILRGNNSNRFTTQVNRNGMIMSNKRAAFTTMKMTTPFTSSNIGNRYHNLDVKQYQYLPHGINSRNSLTTLAASASASAPKSSNNKQKKKNNKKSNKKKLNTGGLRRLPVVKSPIELVNRSRKSAYNNCKADSTIKNARNRARKHATIYLDTLTKELCVPLRDVVNGYKHEIANLHSFEKVVADLTVKARQKKDGVSLLNLLNEIHEARKEVLSSGKDWVAKAKYAETAREAMDAMQQGEKGLIEVFETLLDEPLKTLIDLQKSLRTTPAVRLDTPAVVLVGAPNTGKSSIVRAISSATPEVNNYPFTTRGMTLGHVQVFWKDDSTTAAAIIPEVDEIHKGRFKNGKGTGIDGSYAFTQLCQVMDSPGLLVRESDDKRNEMEALTLAAMQHLPTAVMYVMDLSGGAGDKCSSVEDQLALRRDVRARFPRRPWIDVVSKYDLGVVEGAREQLEEILDGTPYIELSIKEGTGVDELRDEVMRMLGEVRVVLDAMAAVDTRSARPTK
jgi:nucleolar GTP-binding protein